LTARSFSLEKRASHADGLQIIEVQMGREISVGDKRKYSLKTM
jgi:hypothetical protein